MLRSRKGKGRCVTWRNRQGKLVGSCCLTTTPFHLQCLLLGVPNPLMRISTKSLPASSVLPSGWVPSPSLHLFIYSFSVTSFFCLCLDPRDQNFQKFLRFMCAPPPTLFSFTIHLGDYIYSYKVFFFFY
jgi:hypothetical protein